METDQSSKELGFVLWKKNSCTFKQDTHNKKWFMEEPTQCTPTFFSLRPPAQNNQLGHEKF